MLKPHRTLYPLLCLCIAVVGCDPEIYVRPQDTPPGLDDGGPSPDAEIVDAPLRRGATEPPTGRFEARVADGADDADVSLSSEWLDATFSQLYLSSTYRDQGTALRFRHVDVPTDAGIRQATLTLTALEEGAGGVGFTVYALREAHAAPFTTQPELVARARSEAVGRFEGIWSAGAVVEVDVSDAVAEALSAPGRVAGGALALLVVANNDDGDLLAHAYESDPARAARLTIDWRASEPTEPTFPEPTEPADPEPTEPTEPADPEPTDPASGPARLPGLPPFQARGGSAGAAVGYSLPSDWTYDDRRVAGASDQRPYHPSVGAYNMDNTLSAYLGASRFYRRSDNRMTGQLSTGGGSLNQQWDFGSDGFLYVDRNFALHRQSTDGADEVLFTRGQASDFYGESFDRVIAGRHEGLIAGKRRNRGRQLGFFYGMRGRRATFFAYDLTNRRFLPRVQRVDLPGDGVEFDFISATLDSGFGVVKPRAQSTPDPVPWWFFPLLEDGVGERVASEHNQVGHATPAYYTVDGVLREAWVMLYGSNIRVYDPATGRLWLEKRVEGHWAKHIGYVDNTDFVIAYDGEGRMAMERTNGTGGYPLGDGCASSEAYVGATRYLPGQPMAIVFRAADGSLVERTYRRR